MALKDMVDRNGHIRFGAFNKPQPVNVPIIGGKPKGRFEPPFFVDFGMVSVQAPMPASEGQPARGYVVTLAAMKTPAPGTTRTMQPSCQFEIPVTASIQQIIELFAGGMQYVNTFRHCACEPGVICKIHTPPPAPDQKLLVEP